MPINPFIDGLLVTSRHCGQCLSRFWHESIMLFSKWQLSCTSIDYCWNSTQFARVSLNRLCCAAALHPVLFLWHTLPLMYIFRSAALSQTVSNGSWTTRRQTCSSTANKSPTSHKIKVRRRRGQQAYRDVWQIRNIVLKRSLFRPMYERTNTAEHCGRSCKTIGLIQYNTIQNFVTRT